MVDMEETDLFVLLPQNKEHSVQQLNDLREVVPPDDTCHLSREDNMEKVSGAQCVLCTRSGLGSLE